MYTYIPYKPTKLTRVFDLKNQVPVTLAAPTRLDPERPEYQRVVVAWDEAKQVRGRVGGPVWFGVI